MVRDCYLEPSLGVTYERTLAALRANSRAGRPTLVELHRLNFLDNKWVAQHPLDEVTRLRKLARATGAAIRAWLTYAVTHPGGFGDAVTLP